MKTSKVIKIAIEVESSEINNYADIGDFVHDTLELQLENEKEFGNIKNYKLEIVD